MQSIYLLFCIGDGAQGWEEEAPFDAIIVTAAAETVPEALLKQLKENGRLLIPVGAEHEDQVLTLIKKDEQGALFHKPILGVKFVPLK